MAHVAAVADKPNRLARLGGGRQAERIGGEAQGARRPVISRGR